MDVARSARALRRPQATTAATALVSLVIKAIKMTVRRNGFKSTFLNASVPLCLRTINYICIPDEFLVSLTFSPFFHAVSFFLLVFDAILSPCTSSSMKYFGTFTSS